MYEIQRASSISSAAAVAIARVPRPTGCCLRPDRRTPLVSPVSRLLLRLPKFPPAGPPSCGDKEICMPSRPGAQEASGHHFGAFFVVHMMSTSCVRLSPLASSSSTACPPRHPQRGELTRARSGHETGVSKVTVRLSADEIDVMCNCINEALDALTDGDFQQRVGADRQQARALLGRLDERRTAARRAAEV